MAADETLDLQQLAEKVEQLCARCEQLHHENTALQREVHQLRERCDKAKQEIGALISTLPEYD